MFFANTAQGVKPYANRANDPINWAEACPGCLVVKLSPADYQTAYDWVNAGHYTGAIAPALVPDAEGREPGAEGYEPTHDQGTAPHWALLGNTVALDGATVTLLDPEGQPSQTLTGVIVQAAA